MLAMISVMPKRENPYSARPEAHRGRRPQRVERVDVRGLHRLEHEPRRYDPNRAITSRTASLATNSSIFGGEAAPALSKASTAPP